MIKLRDVDTGDLLGSITKDELQFLIDNLEEEWEGDTDYYLNRTTIDMLADAGADKALIELLNKALGERESIEIVWEKS
jgi:processive 1,2-diacylglycerol beta-glucosyltransferase